MNSPVLIADIGGTNARFALETAKGKIEAIAVFNCAEFNTISEVIDSYITSPDVRSLGGAKICKAGIAIANPIHGDIVKMTNHHWEFSIESVQTEFDLQKLLVVNDFKALAMALPSLSPSQKKQVGGGVAIDRSPIALEFNVASRGHSAHLVCPQAETACGRTAQCLSSLILLEGTTGERCGPDFAPGNSKGQEKMCNGSVLCRAEVPGRHRGG